MLALWVKTIKDKYQWFVIDATIIETQELIKNIVNRYNNKKIEYSFKDATDQDIENYGGIQELDVVKYVIEQCCLLDEHGEPER